MPYKAIQQFVTVRPDGHERLVVIGELCADDDPVVLADLDTTNDRLPLQLFRREDTADE